MRLREAGAAIRIPQNLVALALSLKLGNRDAVVTDARIFRFEGSASSAEGFDLGGRHLRLLRDLMLN